MDLLRQAPDPDKAVKLSLAKITDALRRAGRRKIDERARKIQDGLGSEQSRLPSAVQQAYAATVSSLVAMIATTVQQIEHLERELTERFHEHPDSAIYLSQLAGSPAARACYDRQRARGLPHNAALRHVSNRLVGILHGCLATRMIYDEATAWGHHAAASAA